MASTLPLFSMPPEIWLSILAHLSESDFLSLKLSSPYLRNVIANNASTICNTLIMKHYAQEASILRTSFRDGWLVPTHPAVFREEKQISRYTSRSNSLARQGRSRDTSPHPTQGPYSIPVHTKLSEPGPQFLRFLIEYSFEIRVANSMFIDVPARGKTGSGGCCGSKETPQEKLDRWIGLYTIRKFLTRLQKISSGTSSPFSSFGSDKSGEQDSAMLKVTQEGMAWFYE